MQERNKERCVCMQNKSNLLTAKMSFLMAHTHTHTHTGKRIEEEIAITIQYFASQK